MVTLLPATTTLAIWTMTGIFLGFTASIYGAVLRVYRLGAVVHVMDGLWFAMATALTGLVLLATNWGVLRAWTILALMIGYVLWAALVGSWVHRAFYFLFFHQARLLGLVLAFASRAVLSAPQRVARVRKLSVFHPHWPRIRRDKKPPRT